MIPFLRGSRGHLLNQYILEKMNEIENLKKRLKLITQKPIVKNYITKSDKKKKRVIINNKKEFSDKYLIY